MFATKGRLKISLLVVGVLVVGFGIFLAIQTKESEAHPWSCAWMLHKESTPSIFTEYTPVSGRTRSVEGYCDYCGGNAYYTEQLHNVYRTRMSTISHASPWGSYNYCHTHIFRTPKGQTWRRIDSKTCRGYRGPCPAAGGG